MDGYNNFVFTVERSDSREVAVLFTGVLKRAKNTTTTTRLQSDDDNCHIVCAFGRLKCRIK